MKMLCTFEIVIFFFFLFFFWDSDFEVDQVTNNFEHKSLNLYLYSKWNITTLYDSATYFVD